jgi:HD-GYP domain-containing protein (c-di-GMP phosphodiesterase class II)
MPDAVWQQHVGLGITAVERAGNVHPEVLYACLHHHEAWDGSGFPARLAGEDISILGRMAAICDSFDWMLIGGDNQAPLDPAAAIRQLQQDAVKFDGDILRRFIEMVGFYPIGSFVQLRNGLLAMVIDVHENHPTRPVVRTFYSPDRSERIQGKTLNLLECDTDLEIAESAELEQIDLPDEVALREYLFFECLKR